MASAVETTFVCCVESGWLEAQTVRLVESLRRFGGRYADSPVVAITPRFGPPLQETTKRLFKSLKIDHLRLPNGGYSWFNYYNKPLAVLAAEDRVETGAICFLDSDLLFVDEPDCLELAEGEDLLAFPVETKEMGTTGPGDPYDEFWQASSKVAGLAYESLPWVTTAQTGHRIRLYFNSGLFIYRRSCGFAEEYLRLCRALLDSRIGTRAQGYGLGFKEQVAVAFAAMTLGLRWRALPYSHNYPMSKATHLEWYSPDALRAAKIVHYHDAMWPDFWPVFMECMSQTHPRVAEWLATLGPMRNRAALHHRALSRLLHRVRARSARRYLAGSQIY